MSTTTTTSMKLMRAVEASDLVVAFKDYGVSQADLATVAEVDPKTVYAWKAKSARPRATSYTRLDGLRDVVSVLSDSLTSRGVGQWLHAQNRALGGKRPLDVLREGNQQAVLEAARSFIDGSYV